jgi:hypothetical protein
MKRKLKIPAKRAPMPEGYDGVTMTKQQGSPALQGVGGVHAIKISPAPAWLYVSVTTLAASLIYHDL